MYTSRAQNPTDIKFRYLRENCQKIPRLPPPNTYKCQHSFHFNNLHLTVDTYYKAPDTSSGKVSSNIAELLVLLLIHLFTSSSHGS